MKLEIWNWTAYLWDCLEVMKTIPDNSIDCIITDPPYKTIRWWNKSEKWKYWYKNSILSKNDWKWWLEYNDIKITDYIWEFYRILKDWTHLYIMTNNKNLEMFLTEIRKAWFDFHNFLVWEKKQCNTNRWYLRNTEYILFFKKWKCKTINNPSTFPILRFKKETFMNEHPNKKPYELFETFVSNSSKEWEIILDPFSWSMVLADVCENLNRKWICVEKDETYFNIWVERIQELI